MALMMALGVELVLFRFHLHGRHEVDTHLHMLLVYTIAASIVVVGIEMLYPHSITVLLARFVNDYLFTECFEKYITCITRASAFNTNTY